MTERKICIVCFSRALGGLELTTLRLARAFLDEGHRVTLVALPGSPLAARATEQGVRVLTFKPLLKYFDPVTSIRLADRFVELAIEFVILMQSKDIHVAALAKTLYSAPKLVFYQQMQSGYDKRDPVHTWVYSRLSLWITLTEKMKREVLSHTNVPEDRIRVVPLGADLGDFDPSKYDQQSERERFGLPRDRVLVGALGRLDPQKGQEVLLRAIPLVLRSHPEAFFVIAGDETHGEGGYRQYLQTLVEDLGITSSVRFIPFTDEVPRFLAALDLFVLPSYSETYGLVVIEAMAMEKPVIATDAGGVPEIVVDGRTGILVQPRRAEALATAILRILDGAALRKDLGRRAREDAINRFDFDRTVKSLLQFLQSL